MVELPGATLVATWPGASPRAMEARVVAPLERALGRVRGAGRLESYSASNHGWIRVSGSRERSHGGFLAEVADQVAAVQETLPPGAAVRFERRVPESLRDQRGFLVVQVLSADSSSAARTIAQERVAPRLRALPAVAGVTVEGGQEREVFVELRMDALEAQGLVYSNVEDLIRQALAESEPGSLLGVGGRPSLVLVGVGGVEELRRLPLDREGALRLADVAEVGYGPARPRSVRRIDGKPVVTLEIDRASDQGILEAARQVHREVEALVAELPPSYQLLIADDRSERVLRDLQDVAVRGGLGVFGVILVLLLLLRRGRPVLVTLFAVIVSLASSFLLLAPLDLTLNVITIAGLVLLTGLLVDNVVLVVEQVGGLGSRMHSPHRVAEALEEILMPLAAGTVTTITVFLPLASTGGELRSLFMSLSLVFALTLVTSMGVAALLVPAFVRPGEVRHRRRQRRFTAWEGLLKLAQEYPVVTLGVFFLLLGLPTGTLPHRWTVGPTTSPAVQRVAERYNTTVGSELVRRSRQWLDPLLGGVTSPFLKEVSLGRGWSPDSPDELRVHFRLPSGTGLMRSSKLAAGFEGLALDSPAVERTLLRVAEDRALLEIQFSDESLSKREPYVLREALIRRALDSAGCEIVISGLVPVGFQAGVGSVNGYGIAVLGAEYEKVGELAESLERQLQTVPRIASVDVDADRSGAPSREVLYLPWSSGQVQLPWATTRDLAALLRPALLPDASLLETPFGKWPNALRVRFSNWDDLDVHGLERLRLDFGEGRYLRLLDHGPIALRSQPPTIERLDQQYRRYVNVLYNGPHRLAEKMLAEQVASFAVPAGYRVELMGQGQSGRRKILELLAVLAACVAIIYLCLAAVFESWRLPVLVLLGVPLCLLGVFPAFSLLDADFGEGAYLGVVLLAGLGVNVTVVIVDRWRRLRRRRSGCPSDLMRLAIRQRLRMVWATTLTSGAGMVPLLMGSEVNAFWSGLALVVLSGLLATAILSPVALIAAVSWHERNRVKAGSPSVFPSPPLRPTR